EKERLERELQVARQIQESILPRVLPQLPGFSLGARMIPARAVGGDLYDFILLGGDRLGVVIGDVSDKGVPAAIFMALSRSLLRAEAHPSRPPGEVLANVNYHLMTMNDSGMFVTVLYGILNRANGEFTYARAGHPVPWLFDGQGKLIQPDLGLGQPLGILPEPKLDEKTIAIPPGGTVLLFTDGATDASNIQHELFGEERLEQAAHARLGAPAQAMCDQVWQSIMQFQDARHQADDVTLLLVRYRAAAQAATV
ncbi:MAG: serine/threonine-protein phosphatase, partial [Acidobacteriia bacterium]|nr:serine/threonine-protein phosphatase [Terriglobia bacterium]